MPFSGVPMMSVSTSADFSSRSTSLSAAKPTCKVPHKTSERPIANPYRICMSSRRFWATTIRNHRFLIPALQQYLKLLFCHSREGRGEWIYRSTGLVEYVLSGMDPAWVEKQRRRTARCRPAGRSLEVTRTRSDRFPPTPDRRSGWRPATHPRSFPFRYRRLDEPEWC